MRLRIAAREAFKNRMQDIIMDILSVKFSDHSPLKENRG